MPAHPAAASDSPSIATARATAISDEMREWRRTRRASALFAIKLTRYDFLGRTGMPDAASVSQKRPAGWIPSKRHAANCSPDHFSRRLR